MAFYKKNKNKKSTQANVNTTIKTKDIKFNNQSNNTSNSNNNTNIQTIEQMRAKKALEEIFKIVEKDEATKKEFKSYTNELPAMIHMNGLGQAVAFYKSKGNTHNLLYTILSDWLGRNQPYSEGDLLKNITKSSMGKYQMAQSEAQALLVWLKSFAKAYL